MKIYYDGLDIEKYCNNSLVQGYTTNCCFFSQNTITNYKEYFDSNKQFLKENDISFQTWKNGVDGINQINDIYKINENIFVKIPIINSENEYNTDLILHAFANNMRVNITAIYTFDQINKIYELLNNSTYYNTNVIISIFAGPISDTGADPSPYILYSKQIFKKYKNIEILWAGCRELYSIIRAKNLDCDIITVPGEIIDKLSLLNYDLATLSIERVNKFRNDALKGKLSIL
jgi:transaldolase